jgi:hypothetical protein
MKQLLPLGYCFGLGREQFQLSEHLSVLSSYHQTCVLKSTCIPLRSHSGLQLWAAIQHKISEHLSVLWAPIIKHSSQDQHAYRWEILLLASFISLLRIEISISYELILSGMNSEINMNTTERYYFQQTLFSQDTKAKPASPSHSCIYHILWSKKTHIFTAERHYFSELHFFKTQPQKQYLHSFHTSVASPNHKNSPLHHWDPLYRRASFL